MKQLVFISLSIICLLVCLNHLTSAEEILYARYPALSPDGKTIAFTYMGDIWTVPSSGGEANRLTVHDAEDIRPQFSPDGKMIMFTSSRFNNYDVFVIPVEGGEPKQLTFHSIRDIGSGWFPGSDSIVFTSSRDGWRDIFKVSIDGGMPIRLTGYPYEQEYNGRISADGRYLLYNSGSGMSRWYRRDLRSGRNADIYIQDRTKDKFSSIRLTDYPNHDVWPILNQESNEVYFVSCRGEWAQIWKVPVTGGEPIQLTHFTGDGVQWLNSNPQGTVLVFEQGFNIWLMDLRNAQPQEISIQIRSDDKHNLVKKKTFDGNVEWFSLSPDEKKIVAVIHGEIFVLPAKEPEEAKRITFSSARETFPVWGSDSKIIYYSSDRDGNYEIYSADVTGLKETRLTNSSENEVKPIVSPDGKYIAYYKGLDKIIRRDLSSGKEEVWIDGVFFDLGVEPTIEYDWSDDSRWLVFTMAGSTYETDIYVANLDGEMYNISRFAGWNFRPRFSKDGKKVTFSSYVNNKTETYRIDLVHKPVEFFESSFDSLFLAEEENKKKKNDTTGKEPEPVKIDIDRIETRRAKAFKLEASSEYPILSADGKKYYFVASILGKSEIWSINAEDDDPDLKQLTHSGKKKTYLYVTSDSRKLLFLEDGKIRRYIIDDNKLESLSFKATMDIDILANNRQKFHETWQMLNTYFYDSSFHGTNWDDIREKYEPALRHIRTEREFRNLIFEMMGELRASHLYIYSKEPAPDKEIVTGETGIDLDYAVLDREGLFRTGNITSNSPADIAGIRTGQFIRHINGTPLSRNVNINELLAGTKGHRLIITVSDKANGESTDIELKPVSRSVRSDLVYLDWVAERRHIVDSLSNGRLAYIHIQNMDRKNLERFQQELVSIAEQKEGLIIDVRDNGGGYVAVHLLGILVKTPYILRNFRGLPATSENKMRSKAYEKPMALLINNYSGSNSEIFCEGFRKLKLGKIIGEPTSGGVIGTSSYTLIDGTRIRRPSWGSYTIEMEDTDLRPRHPDIFVENLPDDFLNGRDPQLARAIEELLKEL